MKTFHKTILGVGLLGATLLAQSYSTETTAYAQENTSGSLRGQIRDKANNDVAVGATVVATSPALQGEQVVITDDKGLYFITSLPPGIYTLTVYYQDNTFSRGNVLIQVGKEAVVNVTVNTAVAGAKKGETIVIQGSAPVIDQGSQKTGVTITDDYTRNVPVGRTFGEVLGAAASSQGDEYGTSISGATSVENTYIVEGINTTDTSFGLLSSNLPNEFVQETEVITGGYNAEYGRATGGIINVVTKSGGNEFHGSVFGYLTPGALVSAARTVAVQGASVEAADNLNYNYDVGGELGGPIIKDKLWFHLGFNPNSANATTTRSVTTQVDENQDGIPDVDPTTGFVIAKPIPGASQDLNHHLNTYYFTGKLSGQIDPNNLFELSAFGNPQKGNTTTAVAFAGDGLAFAPQDSFINESTGAADVVAKYTSKLNDGKTQIDAQAGYHHGYNYATSPGAVGNEPLTQYAYSRSLYDFADLEGAQKIAACNDAAANDPYPKIQNCPVNNYVEQGLGLLEHRNNDRYSAKLELTQRVELLGNHTFKGGIDYEGSTYNTTQAYTGGEALTRNCNEDPTTGTCTDSTAPGSFLPGEWSAQGYDTFVRKTTAAEQATAAAGGMVNLPAGDVLCNNNLNVCGPSATHLANTSDRSIGAYLQDSWLVLPNLTVDFGLRYEQQVAFNASEVQGTLSPTGQVVPAAAFTLNDWAPRLGINWDPTSEGKSKIFAHYGRFFENVPMDINVRSFGGEIDSSNNIGVPVNGQSTIAQGAPGYDPNCNVDHVPGGGASIGPTLAKCMYQQPSVFGAGEEAAPGLRGQYTDEYIAGGEYEFLPDFKVGLTFTRRTLPVIIEDASTDDALYYVIANPGTNADAEANTLATKAAAEMMNPATAAQGVQDAETADTLKRLKNEDPPSRNFDSMTLHVEQRPTHKSLVIASYTYSQEKGNYPGLFSTETGQLDPNITSQYDLPELLANRYGKLGLDRPSNLKLDGFYEFDLHNLGLITAGASIRVESGIPINALGRNPLYNQFPGEVYVLPRGSDGRTPATEEFDVHLSYGRRVGNGKAEVFVNIFNLFDQQQTVNVDQSYTFDFVNPIVNGNSSDLSHLKQETELGTPTNITPTVNPNFKQATAYGLPRNVQFGARYTF